MPRLVCISDTHGDHRAVRLPAARPGDVLVHAGDITRFGRVADAADFDAWAGASGFDDVVAVTGNHDAPVLTELRPLLRHVRLLEDETVTLRCGLRVRGCSWLGFGYPRREALAALLRCRDPVDVLVTHEPAAGAGVGRGSEAVREAVAALGARVHVSGHEHGAYGASVATAADGGVVNVVGALIDVVGDAVAAADDAVVRELPAARDGTVTFVNAAICGADGYKARNAAIRVALEHAV